MQSTHSRHVASEANAWELTFLEDMEPGTIQPNEEEPMARTLTLVAALMLAASAGYGGAMAATVAGEVAEIQAVCRNGQSFVTWKDAAEGEADAKLRYTL